MNKRKSKKIARAFVDGRHISRRYYAIHEVGSWDWDGFENYVYITFKSTAIRREYHRMWWEKYGQENMPQHPMLLLAETENGVWYVNPSCPEELRPA
jgi:hypothetical protein